MAYESDDPRDVELGSLTAIYPEIQRVRPDDPYYVTLEVPVTPSKAVSVCFPAADNGGLPLVQAQANGIVSAEVANAAAAAPPQIDSHEVSHLPPLRLELKFGPSYPSEEAPHVSISTSPPWLPLDTIGKLEDDAARLWEEMGRDMVGFTYIDHVQQASEGVFGLVDANGTLEVDPRHKISILDYDIKARRAAFERETFDCGVCLDPKKGSACHKMMDCGHVFCVQCLQDVYNNAIKEGDLASVRCLTPNCAKEREKALSGKRKSKKLLISPSELLQIPLDQETVKRFVTLRYKAELESDKNTIYCPRQWCNGAARSRKHKKPQGLELVEGSDESDDEDGDNDDDSKPSKELKPKPYEAATELLCICDDCGFAFCSRCFQSWHGEFYRCSPRRKNGEITAEEAASLEYMKLHTTPCPTCAAPAQKTHGCNHMICGRCDTHFCYLCASWLDPGNPYRHFNEIPGGRVNGCYMRLWELEDGDGDDVGIGFRGGRQEAIPARPPVQERVALVPEIEEPEDGDVARRPAPEAPHGNLAYGEVPADGGQVGIAREGPLVLRIAANPPVGHGRGGPRIRGPVPNPPLAQRGRGAGRGRGRGRGEARGGRGAVQRGEQQPGAGGGVGLRGGALPGRQNDNNPANQAQNAQRNNVNNPNQNPANRGQLVLDDEADAARAEEMDPAHADWVRLFVRLAMDDQEHLLGDSDEDSD